MYSVQSFTRPSIVYVDVSRIAGEKKSEMETTTRPNK